MIDGPQQIGGEPSGVDLSDDLPAPARQHCGAEEMHPEGVRQDLREAVLQKCLPSAEHGRPEEVETDEERQAAHPLHQECRAVLEFALPGEAIREAVLFEHRSLCLAPAGA